MNGINLDKPINYYFASFRYFQKGEHHIERDCADDVLIMVFKGVLRFSEDGLEYELAPGEYYIQRHGLHQAGEVASDAPQYLYIHFYADWGNKDNDDERHLLPRRGYFDIEGLMPVMKEMDSLSHAVVSNAERLAVFYKILSLLYTGKLPLTVEERIAKYLAAHYSEKITLEGLSAQFHFSKNHLINVFKKKYHITPYEYLIDLRIKMAARFLEFGTDPIEIVARDCGFGDYASLYKYFYRAYHMSPGAYRRSAIEAKRS
ncbi:AraC family transcriptional regulator [Butyrivibrio sp. MC2013]|uniref:AraC family transcriptional regulator n=1 Tax=Butyrivibrio sp. MC2013 TaxID=1280686 RepID=UPI0004263679|nr:AraC family transcriptional regulator [Butyrivibrio sp. MC2013]